MKKILIVLILFLISILLIGQNLDKPFSGEHDWNGVRYGNIARNYLRYGLWETKLGQVENSGWVSKKDFEYYTHYPPLLPLLIALSYKIFGISEWSTRLVPLLLTSASISLIFLIGTKGSGMKFGFVAALLTSVLPMTLYFGKNPVHEPLTLFTILFTLWWYLLYKESGKKIFNALFIFGLIISGVSAWAGYFLVPALTLSAVLRRDFQEAKSLSIYWVILILLFSLHFAHTLFLTGSLTGGNLIESLFQRTGLSPEVQPTGFSILGYLNRLRLWFSTLYSVTLVLSSLVWIVFRIKSKFKSSDWIILDLGIVGLIYIVIFSNSVFIHNYLTIYLLPSLTLSGAAVILELSKKFNFKYANFVVPMVFIFLVSFERQDFLQALDKSNPDHFAVEIGQVINAKTEKDATVLVSPKNFQFSADKFLRFYGDRNLIYTDATASTNVLVIVDQTKQKFEIIKR